MLKSEAGPLVVKYIAKILKRRNIRTWPSRINQIGKHRPRSSGFWPFTFFDILSTRNSRRCKHCETHLNNLLGEVTQPYSTIIIKFISSVEFNLTYRMTISKNYKFSEWIHHTTIDLSDPNSFTKLQEFITRHLPRGKST
jgi:hypothetical protein